MVEFSVFYSPVLEVTYDHSLCSIGGIDYPWSHGGGTTQEVNTERQGPLGLISEVGDYTGPEVSKGSNEVGAVVLLT